MVVVYVPSKNALQSSAATIGDQIDKSNTIGVCVSESTTFIDGRWALALRVLGCTHIGCMHTSHETNQASFT